MAKTAFIQGQTNYENWRAAHEDNNVFKARLSVITEMRIKVANGEKLTPLDEIRLVQQVAITRLTGKLEGFWAISTSVLMNPICQKRAQDPDSICAHCYAASGASRYSGLAQAIEINFYILNEFLISEEAWATLQLPTTTGDFRIESHGDVASVTCCRNYLRIIKTHSWMNFGVWSKNIQLWMKAADLEGGKPEKMRFIYSSCYIGKVDELTPEQMAFCDHRFTVLAVKPDDIKVNCGARSCANCHKCYESGTTFEIYEALK